MAESPASQIIEAIGGANNVRSLTHCATRLRFELTDAARVNKDALDIMPGVLGAVPQSGNRYQVVIGGAVASVYNDIMHLPEMVNVKGGEVTDDDGEMSDADVKAAARSKARGKVAWLDSFFEYLSDSFRPILGVLLGASLIIAFAAVLDALGVVDFRAEDKPATWVFVDTMWRAVFYFLPIMIAYNASKKLKVDPWVGAAVMGALMTPDFMKLSSAADTVCTTNKTLGTDSCVAHIFGLPMQLNDYGGQVFVPLIMVAVLALVYRVLVKIFPQNVQMVFVPFFSLIIMVPVTAFLLGPLGIWLGSGLGAGLAWMNNHAPFVFAIVIPMIYPFPVPLGLHWPLNALMLMNIQTLGYDFIQGPMGVWNFACFGATAGVLFLSIRDKDVTMRQTATGALAAGLLGGISEPSLYGIHLRFKLIYKRMLIGCAVGGVTIAILSLPYHGVSTSAFAFTSLLTIPVFNPMWVYAISVAVAFVVAMVLIIILDYRTPEQKAEVKARVAAAAKKEEVAKAGASSASSPAPVSQDGSAPAPTAVAVAEKTESPAGTLIESLAAPVSGKVIGLEDCGDPVFASRVLGEGVAVIPSDSHVKAPVSGTLKTVAKTGHAFGIKTDSGVEVLIHVGIDTVKMDGDGFAVAVKQGDRVEAGDLLVTVDFDKVKAAGYSPNTLMTVTNTRAFGSVVAHPGQSESPVVEVLS